MSAKNIECSCCHKDLGTIRDATLRKNISYYCSQCNQLMQTVMQTASDSLSSKIKYKWDDIFNPDKFFKM